MMTSKLKGKTRAAAMKMLRAFHNLVAGEGDDSSSIGGDLRTMRGVRKFPQRVSAPCWRGARWKKRYGRMRANQRFRLKAILTRPSPNELAAMRDDFSNSRLWHQFGAVADDEKMQRKAAPRQRAGSRKENRSVDRSSRIDRARSSRPCRYRDRNSWFLRSISRFASFHRETGACSDA